MEGTRLGRSIECRESNHSHYASPEEVKTESTAIQEIDVRSDRHSSVEISSLHYNRLFRHTHVQQVALGIQVDVAAVLGC